VIVSGRDAADTHDLYQAFDVDTGRLRWEWSCEARGRLDYGNSPRATPLVLDGLVYTQGAFGHASCLDVAVGALVWQRNLAADFGTPPLDWGLAASPLAVDERLILLPGGPRGSLAALDLATGETHWTSGAAPPGYASPLLTELRGVRQIIAYDQFSLGGWSPQTGRRLWTLVPSEPGDFNVPTPIPLGDRLFVATENNGARLYTVRRDGTLDPQPAAVNDEVVPDAHTPVIAGGRLFAVSGALCCLDLNGGLKTIWRRPGREFRDYASLLATDDRVLCLTIDAELILIDATAPDYRELGRCALADEPAETYAHPALLGTRLFVRVGRELLCVDLADRSRDPATAPPAAGQ